MRQDHDTAGQEKIRFLNAADQLDRVAIIEIVQRERVTRDAPLEISAVTAAYAL